MDRNTLKMGTTALAFVPATPGSAPGIPAGNAGAPSGVLDARDGAGPGGGHRTDGRRKDA